MTETPSEEKQLDMFIPEDETKKTQPISEPLKPPTTEELDPNQIKIKLAPDDEKDDPYADLGYPKKPGSR